MTYKVADFFGMWKLAFQDKMDDGHRMSDLLGDLATDDKGNHIKKLVKSHKRSRLKFLIMLVILYIIKCP